MWHWKFSKLLLCLYISFYVMGLLVICLLPIGAIWQILFIVTLSSYALWIMLKHILFLLPTSFITLRKDTDHWCIFSQKAGWQRLQLLSDQCFVVAWLVILWFRVEGSRKRFVLCLPLGVMPKEEYRKLRVYLRYLV